MFTGIVEVSVPTRSFESSGGGARLVLPAPADPSWAVDLGESVAVSGVCLTVAALVSPQAGSGEPVPAGTPGADMVFDLSAEELRDVVFFAKALFNEDLAELLAALLLQLEREVKILVTDLIFSDQQIAEALPLARGEKRDLTFGEEDFLLALAVIDDQRARVTVHRQRLENVAEV